MSVRAKVLVLLAIVDVALVTMASVVKTRAGELAEQVEDLEARRTLFLRLREQEGALGRLFEERMAVLVEGAARSGLSDLYDTIGARLLARAPGLRVRGLDYSYNAAGEYARLTVRMPIESSPFESVVAFLAAIEELQDKVWLSVQSLRLEEKMAPRAGVGGDATLVLYFRRKPAGAPTKG